MVARERLEYVRARALGERPQGDDRAGALKEPPCGRQRDCVVIYVGSWPRERECIVIYEGSRPRERERVAIYEGSWPRRRECVVIYEGSWPRQRERAVIYKGSWPRQRECVVIYIGKRSVFSSGGPKRAHRWFRVHALGFLFPTT